MKNLKYIVIGFLFYMPIICQAQLKPDKYYHIGAGTLIATGTHFSQRFFVREMNPIAPTLMAFTAGVGKEFYDVYKKKHFSGKDIFWTTISGVVTNIILRAVCKQKPKQKVFEPEYFNPPLVKN